MKYAVVLVAVITSTSAQAGDWSGYGAPGSPAANASASSGSGGFQARSRAGVSLEGIASFFSGAFSFGWSILTRSAPSGPPSGGVRGMDPGSRGSGVTWG